MRNILVKIIFTTQTDLSSEGVVHEPEQISEEISVGVLAELVEDEPVPQIAVAQHVLTAGQVGGREAPDLEDDKEPSQGRNQDGEQSEEEVGGGQNCQSKHPEPQQQVNLDLLLYNLISM